MSDFETKDLDESLQQQEKLEQSFGKETLKGLKDKALLAEGMGNKDNKDKFDKNDLDKGIDTALHNKINKSMGNLGNNDGAKALAEFQKQGLMDNIKKEQDPKKKIEMFQEIVDKINSIEGTQHAEMKEQDKKFSETQGNNEKKQKEDLNDFSKKIKMLTDIMTDAIKKRITKEREAIKEASERGNKEKGNNEQSAKIEIEKGLKESFPS